jgi:hypothetical protein
MSQRTIALTQNAGLTHPSQHSFAGAGFQSWFLFGKIDALVPGSDGNGSISDDQR